MQYPLASNNNCVNVNRLVTETVNPLHPGAVAPLRSKAVVMCVTVPGEEAMRR